MALNITTPITTEFGIELPTSYARVSVLNLTKGNIVDFSMQVFASKEAYDAGASQIYVTGIEGSGYIEYDYATDNKDILDLAHDALIIVLENQGVTATKTF